MRINLCGNDNEVRLRFESLNGLFKRDSKLHNAQRDKQQVATQARQIRETGVTGESGYDVLHVTQHAHVNTGKRCIKCATRMW